jgi:hypothetical protein
MKDAETAVGAGDDSARQESIQTFFVRGMRVKGMEGRLL